MTGKNKRQLLADISESFGLDVVYAFGSRAAEAQQTLVEDRDGLARTASDLDIGVLARGPLDLDGKVELAAALEDLFGAPRVDLLDLSRAAPYLALEAVCGELLHARDAEKEARYQLYVLRRAADLLPFQRQRDKSVLGF